MEAIEIVTSPLLSVKPARRANSALQTALHPVPHFVLHVLQAPSQPILMLRVAIIVLLALTLALDPLLVPLVLLAPTRLPWLPHARKEILLCSYECVCMYAWIFLYSTMLCIDICDLYDGLVERKYTCVCFVITYVIL